MTRLTVDLEQLAATARPLRDAAEAAGAVYARRAELAAHSEHAGHAELGGAIEDLVGAWGNGLGGVAQHADGLARMLDLAGHTYAETETRTRRRATHGDGQ
ncbi:MAG: hypothetical protein ACR2FF_05115 [Mycobacteriales bacterium]|nr:MAG: hypothetical protein DLM56_13475 [Pseudonocardiales bacterium]